MNDGLGPLRNEFTAEIVARIEAEVVALRVHADRQGCGIRIIFYAELIGWSVTVASDVAVGGIEVLRSHPS